MTQPARVVTGEELFQYPDSKHYELVRPRVSEPPAASTVGSPPALAPVSPIIAAANAPGTPVAAATATAPNAPAMIVPSRPILIVPDRSTSVSPNAASASGVAVRTVASRNGAMGSITVLQRPLAA